MSLRVGSSANGRRKNSVEQFGVTAAGQASLLRGVHRVTFDFRVEASSFLPASVTTCHTATPRASAIAVSPAKTVGSMRTFG